MIVGAGVVGCYLSRLTGVPIWEKNKEIVEKPCSSLLSVSGLRNLKIDYANCVLNEINGAVLHSPSHEFEINKKNVAVVLDRLAFQKSLAADCEIEFGKTWKGKKDNLIIGADGALSAVAKSIGVAHDLIWTYQVLAEHKMDEDRVHVYFGDAPGFFAWRIPRGDGTAEIGLGATENPSPHFDNFIKKFKIGKIFKTQAAPIPIFNGKKTAQGNTALVGDAAAQVKLSTGGGIVFGCKCAQVLAGAIKRGDLQYYEKEWRRRYESDLKMHLRVRKFLNSVDYDEFFFALIENDVPALLEKHGDLDKTAFLRKVLKKPRLLRYLPKFLF